MVAVLEQKAEQVLGVFESWSNRFGFVEAVRDLSNYDCDWCNTGCGGCSGCGSEGGYLPKSLSTSENSVASESYDVSCSGCNGCNSCS